MTNYEMASFRSAELANGAAPEILFEMGLIYATGRNGDADVVSAHKWFNIAAHRGYGPAKTRREELAIEMSREQIAAAQRAAREWLCAH